MTIQKKDSFTQNSLIGRDWIKLWNGLILKRKDLLWEKLFFFVGQLLTVQSEVLFINVFTKNLALLLDSIVMIITTRNLNFLTLF